MKKIFSHSGWIPFLLLFFSTPSFSQQNDCGNNANFELGTTAGWQCKYGYYGDVNCPPAASCPEFPTVYTNFTPLNPNGINGTLAAQNRHTIVTSAYYGTGLDPNTGAGPPITAVAPGGGNFSFRLGNSDNGGGTGGIPNYAQAEAIRLTFVVTTQNAGFTYRYAAFLQHPIAAFHLPEAEPRFEVILFDSANNQVPCGYYKVIAGDWAGCPSSNLNSFFHKGAYDAVNVSNYYYTDWTSVGLDLSGFIGHPVSIEFRTSDCFPSSFTTSSSNSVPCAAGTCTESSYTYANRRNLCGYL